MDPLQSLTDSNRKAPADDTAPAAAAWLHNPHSVEKRLSYAQQLMLDLEQNGEWTGPAYGTPENPADDEEQNPAEGEEENPAHDE